MADKFKVILRYLEKGLRTNIGKKQSCLLLGPRQVGKSTLIESILKNRPESSIVRVPLQDPRIRIEMEKDPGSLVGQVEAKEGNQLLFIDEAQKVPSVFDAVQYLIDKGKVCAILTGSSARKLRKRGANLLPGRVKKILQTPLLWGELGLLKESSLKELKTKNINQKQNYSFEDGLIYGHLPGMLRLSPSDRNDILKSYVELYLEEEIRTEAELRKIGPFARFLELAAAESGSNVNLTKLSNETGVSVPSIKEFYQILEDTLTVERIDPYIKNARKRIISSSRYYFFDIGVRNALARLPLEMETINAQKGLLFEHAVVLEIARRIKTFNKPYKLYYWRTKEGAEVDLIIDTGTKLIPIEIKAGTHIRLTELKGLRSFLEDYSSKAPKGYVITFGGKKEKLSNNILSIPWAEL